MKRKLVRYPLALLCLIPAMYCFLREPSPLWTLATQNTTHALGFAPDGQSLWVYHWDENNDPLVITFEQRDVVTGKVLVEHRVALEITNLDFINQGQFAFIHLNDDGQFACLQVPKRNQAKFKTVDLLINLTTGTAQKLPNAEADAGTYSMSPTGKWLSHHDGKNRIIQDRQSMQTMLTLKNEVPADAKYCCPDQVLFSPDEKWFAVAWSHRDEKGTSLSSEIRFYDTASWSEQSRLRILEAGHCGLVCWQKNQLWCSRGVPGKASLNEHFLDIYRFDATASFPDNVLANTELVDHGYSRNYANPLYVREYRIATQQGVDWYMVKDFRECSQPAWIESLRNMPLLSGTINRFLPRDSLALEFYQTSTKQKLNRLSIQPNSHCCISSDGHWMVVLLNGKNHYGLYSTTALIRWPGYLLVLVVFFILFGRVLGGLNSSQKPV